MSELGKAIPPNDPIQFEFQNFRRFMPNRQSELFKIEFEVNEETFIKLGSFPRDAIGTAALFWTERSGWQDKDEKMQSAATSPKKRGTQRRAAAGPYSQFWASLMKQGLFYCPPVRKVIDRQREYADEPDEKLLYRVFSVDTRADISPTILRNWLYHIIKASDLTNPERERLKEIFRIAEARQAESETIGGEHASAEK